jgi:hypothetical protein
VRQGGTGPVVVAQFANTDSAAATSEARIVFSEGGSWYQAIAGQYVSTTGQCLKFGVSSTANTWTERMRIVATGNVGIGTGSPQTVLHVSRQSVGQGGSIMIDNPGGGTGSSNLLSFADTTMAQPQQAQITCVNDGAFSGHLVFWNKTPGASGNGMRESMRIASNGNIGINVGAPSYALQISTDSAAKPATNTWTITSDARLKQNAKWLEGGLPIIEQLHPVEAEYNGLHGTPQGQRVVSFVVEELRKVLPHCVPSHRGRLRAEDSEETDILDFNSHEILFHLILAVQQLARMQTLEKNN